MNMQNKPRYIYNDRCINCDTTSRKKHTKNGYCAIAPSVMDQYPVRCVGDWSYEKIHWLVSYFEIFSKGMRYKWNNKINYIEICCGPGRCIVRKNKEEIDGTALSILNNEGFQFIQRAVFIDHNKCVVDTLNKRIRYLNKQDKAKAYIGDYNAIGEIKNILKDVPGKSLNLIFIDPTDCSISLSLIKTITGLLQYTDFIINIALYTDLNRNLIKAFLDPRYYKVQSKYSEFLGSKNFFNNENNITFAEKGNLRELRQNFLDEYQANLINLGFEYSAYPIPVRNYYAILFASKHARGLDFWEKAGRIAPYGQRSFQF